MTRVKTSRGVKTASGGGVPNAQATSGGGGDVVTGAGVSVKGLRPSSIKVSEDGGFKGTQPEINFTGNVNVSNDPTNNRVNVDIPVSGGSGSGTVESVTGDGVNNTDPDNPVLSFPTPAEIGAELSGAAAAAQAAAIATAAGDATTKANAAQAFAIQRANHTGTQTSATISDFNTSALAAAPAETVNTIGALINGSASATPNDTDYVGTADASVLKKITWTNVKAFLKTYFDTLYQAVLEADTSTYSVTGVTVDTVLHSFLIPANTILSGDLVHMRMFYLKSGTAGAAQCRVWINTSNDLSGSPVQVARKDFTATQLWSGFERTMILKSATSQEVWAPTGNLSSDIISSTIAISTVSIDFTVDQYFLLSTNPSNAGDTITLTGFSVEIKR